jgi:predicted nucleic acid-binding protein
MSLFVDTGVFYAQHDRDAPRHRTAKRALHRRYKADAPTLEVGEEADNR